MSHYVQRAQHNCLNCAAIVYGRYCHICGQENIEPKETFWHLVTHFVYDVTHFDGKFFSTVKYLLLRPGFLSKEYIIGRRASYLNPIKMYVFISAFFFLFFFSVIKPHFNVGEKKDKKLNYTGIKKKIDNKIIALNAVMKQDDVPLTAKNVIKDQVRLLNLDLETLKKDTTHLSSLNYYNLKNITYFDNDYRSLQQYDSIQNNKPTAEKDGWFLRVFHRRQIQLNEQGSDKDNLPEKLLEKFLHSFPQVFFVSLPLFALLLQLLYVRKKKYYYVDHVIYSVHLYCAMFILMFLLLSISHFEDSDHLHWLGYLTFPLSVYITWYIYKSMKNFYLQKRGKTLLKFLLLLMMSIVVMPFVFMIFFILSYFSL